MERQEISGGPGSGPLSVAIKQEPEDGREPSQKKSRLQITINAGGSNDGQSFSSSSPASNEPSSPDDDFINYGTWTFLLQPYRPFDKLAVQYFNQDNVSEEARQVVEDGEQGNYRWVGDVKGKKKGKGFPLGEFTKWLNGGAKSIVRSFVGGKGNEEAQLIIIFGTLSFSRLLEEWDDEEFNGRLSEWMDVILGGISGGAEVITSFSKGLIGNIIGLGGVPRSLELENEELPCLSGLVIPKVAGVGTKTFVVTVEENNRLERELEEIDMQNKRLKSKKEIDLGKCKEILGITEEIEGKLKGIVLFHSTVDEYTESYRTAPVVSVVHAYLKKNRHVAMSGGIHPTLLCRGTNDDDVMACGFLVFGEDDRVRVNCAALLEKFMPLKNRIKLEKLRANLLTTENAAEEVSSFALMFGCFQRGYGMHRRYGVETALFNKILPETQLVGTFDYGEFYREILDCNRNGRKRSAPEQIHDVHLSAFFVVSYVHPKY